MQYPHHLSLPRTGLVQRNLWNVRGKRCHSGLILFARITFAHFSVSSAINFPNSAGEPATAELPRSASRALILGSARPVLISLFNLSTIAAGVFLVTPTPNQVLAS